MVHKQPSLIHRALAQMDLAFWYMRAHPSEMLLLGAPTLGSFAVIGAVAVTVVQTWSLPEVFLYVLFAIAVPTALMWVGVFAPLPCAVFAWHRAAGTVVTPQECFGYCRGKLGRLALVAVRLFFLYLLWFVLFAVLFLVYWPRTCLAPIVALFEENRRIADRCQRLLKEDLAVRVLAALYFLVFLALGFMLFLPRLWLLLQKSFSQTPNSALETPASRWIWDHLWVAEIIGGGLILSVIAVSWCISITLLYRDIRVQREGELLRGRIDQLRGSLFSSQEMEPAPKL